jgi:hypothetical protein
MCRVAGFQITGQFRTGRSDSLSDFVILTATGRRPG